MAEFGGMRGITEAGFGRLEAAVAAPQASMFGEELYAGVVSKAAALCQAIVRAHPFSDGNKRVALVALDLFLEANGFALAATNDQAYTTIMALARGEMTLRRGTRIGSRESGILAACGIAQVAVVRKPKVGVLSTGDELLAPGQALEPASVYDSNGAIVAAAVIEAGGEPIALGAIADDEAALERAIRDALATCDLVLLSGGTSKGAGDLSLVDRREGGGEHPVRVTPGALHLDDRRPEVGQQGAHERRGQERAQVHHAQAGQRPARGRRQCS